MAEHGALRTYRAVVFTAVCVLLTAVGHGLSAGHAPEPAAVLAGAGLLLLIARYLTGRERSLGDITVGVWAAQIGLHLLFNAVPPVAGAGQVDPVGPAHVGHGVAIAVEPHTAGITPGMLLAHIAAGLIAAWWLRQGEAAIWELCRSVLLPLFQVFGLALPVVAVSARPVRVEMSGWARPSRLALRHVVVRRGPPRALFVS